MKKTILAITAILLSLAMVAVGCTTPPAEPTTPPSVAEGPLTGIDTQPPSVTIDTPGGPTTFPITPDTVLTQDGQVCSLEDLAQLEASGLPYNCIVVYRDENGEPLSVNVTKEPPAASVRGEISDVNITESTITVQTSEGNKVYEVDPNTGLLIGGVVCSLGLVERLVDQGSELLCTIIYTVDDQGKAIYVDILNPPGVTRSTGTVVEVIPSQSTITIQTDRGPRTFDIDTATGLSLGGEVCSLDQAKAAAEGAASPCQVVYYTDADGNLIYADITPPEV